MKKITLILVLALVAVYCNAQEKLFERQVPQSVKLALIDKYPDVNIVEWYRQNDSVIEAHFSFNRKKTMAAFSNTGDFISSSSEMAPRETPGLISNYIRGEYPDQSVDVAMMTEDANGQISYFVEISRSGINQPVTKLYFDFYGNLTNIILPPAREMEGDDMVYDDIEDAISVGEPVSRRELPTTATRYMNQNYKDYRFDSAVFTEKDGHGMVYEVKLRRQGYREFIHLYFDLMGDFLQELK